MYKLTLAFLVFEDQVIMINRNKKPWMGCWNGVGGKVKQNEDQIAGVIREIEEETFIKKGDYDLEYKGMLTWSIDKGKTTIEDIVYIYVCKLKKLDLEFPIKTREGILDLKKIDWVIDPNNIGVSHNLRDILSYALFKDGKYHYHCIFDGNALLSVNSTLIEE